MNRTEPPTRYRDPLDSSPPVDMARLAKFFIKGDPTPHPKQSARLARALWEGDPLADAWLEYAQTLPAGEDKVLLRRAIHDGIDSIADPPEPLKALFDQLEALPIWYNPRLMNLAHRTTRRGAIMGELVLSQVSLMGGYRYEGAIRPILMTGRLGSKAARRLGDTSQFVIDVTARNGLERGQPGYVSAIHVRLLHARVRRHLRNHPEWRFEDWGDPINQADMVGTNLLFSITYMISTRILGIRYSADEGRSIIHLWRYVGYLMGIEPELLPADEEEALRLAYTVGVTQTPAPKEVRVLVQALSDVPLERAAPGVLNTKIAKIEQRFRAGVSRFFFGDEAADQLGLPNTMLKHAPLAMIPAVRTMELVRQLTPGGTHLAVALGNAWQTRYMQRVLGDRAPLFRAVHTPDSH